MPNLENIVSSVKTKIACSLLSAIMFFQTPLPVLAQEFKDTEESAEKAEDVEIRKLEYVITSKEYRDCHHTRIESVNGIFRLHPLSPFDVYKNSKKFKTPDVFVAEVYKGGVIQQRFFIDLFSQSKINEGVSVLELYNNGKRGLVIWNSFDLQTGKKNFSGNNFFHYNTSGVCERVTYQTFNLLGNIVETTNSSIIYENGVIKRIISDKNRVNSSQFERIVEEVNEEGVLVKSTKDISYSDPKIIDERLVVEYLQHFRIWVDCGTPEKPKPWDLKAQSGIRVDTIYKDEDKDGIFEIVHSKKVFIDNDLEIENVSEESYSLDKDKDGEYEFKITYTKELATNNSIIFIGKKAEKPEILRKEKFTITQTTSPRINTREVLYGGLENPVFDMIDRKLRWVNAQIPVVVIDFVDEDGDGLKESQIKRTYIIDVAKTGKNSFETRPYLALEEYCEKELPEGGFQNKGTHAPLTEEYPILTSWTHGGISSNLEDIFSKALRILSLD